MAKSTIITTTLTTREKAKELIRDADNKGIDTLDFSNVEFISRSFADEILTQSNSRDISIEGVNESVKKMFKVVKGEKVKA